MVKLGRKDTWGSSHKRIRNTEAEHPVQGIYCMEWKWKELNQKEDEAAHLLGNSYSKIEVDLG